MVGGNRAVIFSLPVSPNSQSACLMATPSKTLSPHVLAVRVHNLPIMLYVPGNVLCYLIFIKYRAKSPQFSTCNSMHSTPYVNSTTEKITSPECSPSLSCFADFNMKPCSHSSLFPASSICTRSVAHTEFRTPPICRRHVPKVTRGEKLSLTNHSNSAKLSTRFLSESSPDQSGPQGSSRLSTLSPPCLPF